MQSMFGIHPYINNRVGPHSSSSVGVTSRLVSLQRMATTAITGALCTMATDTLDLDAGVLLVDLLLHRICHGAMLHLASLPPSHPLQKLVITRAKHYIKTPLPTP